MGVPCMTTQRRLKKMENVSMTDHPNLSLKESEESQGVRKPSTLFL